MQEAVRLSQEMMEDGKGGPFGAIIVKDGKIIGRGSNQVTSTNDPTAHAEVVAIREACRHESSFSLEGAEIYTSCEPCPMCLSAIYWARLDAVYFANNRHEAAAIGFDDAHIYSEIAKELDRREIPMVNLDLPEAKEAFQAWAEKDDKTPY
ncbi:MAG: tRNA-specific adenosine deaminase [Hyphomicrobiales bacterium]|nr:MAG: tRNA-specific adenosine deaminase [Hyphomicrobiales bacterium]